MSLSATKDIISPGAGTGEARLDARQRVIVDNAIALLGRSNTMSAFEYLRSHGVRTQIIERVLLEPLRRRALA